MTSERERGGGDYIIAGDKAVRDLELLPRIHAGVRMLVSAVPPDGVDRIVGMLKSLDRRLERLEDRLMEDADGQE